VEDWEGTVELAETVTVPPLSVRIARCCVVRRDDSTVIKVLRNQEVLLVDPEGLPGVYLAQIVVTLSEDTSSSNAGDSTPFMVNKVKPPLVEFVFSPCDEENVNSNLSLPMKHSHSKANTCIFPTVHSQHDKIKLLLSKFIDFYAHS